MGRTTALPDRGTARPCVCRAQRSCHPTLPTTDGKAGRTASRFSLSVQVRGRRTGVVSGSTHASRQEKSKGPHRTNRRVGERLYCAATKLATRSFTIRRQEAALKTHQIYFDCRACRTSNPVPASKMLTTSYIECPACGVLNILSAEQRGIRSQRAHPGELRCEAEC